MKRHRTIKEAFGEVQRNKAGKRLCLYCGRILKKHKVRWCCWVCRCVARQECDPAYMRYYVDHRDKGVCAKCGLNTENVKVAVLELSEKYGEGSKFFRQHVILMWGAWALGDHLWEMHHKQAVSEGGPIWGLDNLTTLCVPCHREETKRLRGRLAWRGKGRVRGAPVPERLQ